MTTDRKVLITGATGFIGAYTLRLLLKRGYAVRALRRRTSPLDLVRDVADQVEWVEGDVTDLFALEEAFQGVTHVCHCAAVVSFRSSDERRMMRVNVEGTANMVNFALDAGVRHFVHVSSIAALGRAPNRPQLDETCAWVDSPTNTRYAISKYLSEQEVWRAHAEGLPIAIVSPAMVLGSGFWNVGTGRIFQQIYRGMKLYPMGQNGFVDVRDVAQFIVLLLERGIQSERYILSAQDMLFRDLFFQIADALGVRRPFIKVTPFLAEIGWRLEWLKSQLLGADPLLTRDSARASMGRFSYSNAKSLSVGGFAYRPIEQTIQETAAQFLEAAKNGFAPKVLPME
ncbi:MAG: SDR family NAD(P)-dependent oxidoreductase [Saprospiraceae bacterium]|nr:SDR family NAD(P)-dependent oxidoreductase [Saprospiraceae bacterium]MDW8228439.1 SDR family NAD(P)-dependent oxidoreductase [Saprospiraceae bacterium]